MFCADQIGPNDQETNVVRKEGESVTLKCSYETSSQYIWLYWYRQYPNGALQYLLLKGARQRSNSDTVDRRFKSITFWSSTELSVTELKLADTALYYCAFRDVRAH